MICDGIWFLYSSNVFLSYPILTRKLLTTCWIKVIYPHKSWMISYIFNKHVDTAGLKSIQYLVDVTIQMTLNDFNRNECD